MQIIKKYDKGFIGNMERKRQEKKLFKKGYKVVSEEESREFNGAMGCGLFMIFPPLALLASKPKIKVIYSND